MNRVPAKYVEIAIVQAYRGRITTLKDNFAHRAFWVLKTLLVKNFDGFQVNQVAKRFFGP